MTAVFYAIWQFGGIQMSHEAYVDSLELLTRECAGVRGWGRTRPEG